MIYLDNAATTATYASSARIAAEVSVGNYFNPSALYKEASEMTSALKAARETVKKALRGSGGELYFLSGGTEADNTALLCAKRNRNGRIIVSQGEHDAVINTALELKNRGAAVEFTPIKAAGTVDEEAFFKMLDENVALVSIMHVSNETGGVNDIKKLAKMTKAKSPSALFHSDGVQAFCKIPVDLGDSGVDMYSVSGHKIHAPKGIGALWIKNGASVKPFIYGGGQEKGFRSGTENTAAILAFADAVNNNINNFSHNYSKKVQFLEYLRNGIEEILPDTVFLTPLSGAAPHILTVAFAKVRGEVVLHALEKHGILVGIGSACSSHRESRFKKLLGLDEAHKDGIVRFSVSEFNEIHEADKVLKAIEKELPELRKFGRI